VLINFGLFNKGMYVPWSKDKNLFSNRIVL
jgi:hypothetical protein